MSDKAWFENQIDLIEENKYFIMIIVGIVIFIFSIIFIICIYNLGYLTIGD